MDNIVNYGAFVMGATAFVRIYQTHVAYYYWCTSSTI